MNMRTNQMQARQQARLVFTYHNPPAPKSSHDASELRKTRRLDGSSLQSFWIESKSFPAASAS
jgi:hypothetical protein